MARQYADGKEEYRAVVSYTIGTWKPVKFRANPVFESERRGEHVTVVYGPYKSVGSATTAAKAAIAASYDAYWFVLEDLTITIQKAEVNWTNVGS